MLETKAWVKAPYDAQAAACAESGVLPAGTKTSYPHSLSVTGETGQQSYRAPNSSLHFIFLQLESLPVLAKERHELIRCMYCMCITIATDSSPVQMLRINALPEKAY